VGNFNQDALNPRPGTHGTTEPITVIAGTQLGHRNLKLQSGPTGPTARKLQSGPTGPTARKLQSGPTGPTARKLHQSEIP
jgi:hypothetical protein